ncbi:unnamed protein product [Arabidopsis thaliana]|uniref:Uncharacterized protein n=1 Tax=Arabidopsis thaliana TaxID=3702 RepID=A0A654G3S1_ARATH|nr:unnamed protein product [Arabidopsis thaliana]
MANSGPGLDISDISNSEYIASTPNPQVLIDHDSSFTIQAIFQNSSIEPLRRQRFPNTEEVNICVYSFSS